MRTGRTMLVTATKQAGVSLPPIPPELSIQYQIGTDSRPRSVAVRGTSVCGRVTSAPLRKANGLALPMGCPSLTSRGRQLAGGAEVLIRTSTDEGRVGRRYGIRMKSMTTDLDLSLPSLRVPATGRSKEAACLMGRIGNMTDLELIFTAAMNPACSKGDVCLLATLLRAMGSSTHIDASLDELAKETGNHRTTVCRSLDRLVSENYIVRISGGPEQMNRYKRVES